MKYHLQALITPKVRVITASFMSAITWFAWAYWVNIDNADQALISGSSQGIVNLFTTAIGSTALETLFVRYGDSTKGKLVAILSVSSVSLCFMVTSHLIADTPNLFTTIFPVYSVVVLYCSAYIFGLEKVKRQDETLAVSV